MAAWGRSGDALRALRIERMTGTTGTTGTIWFACVQRARLAPSLWGASGALTQALNVVRFREARIKQMGHRDWARASGLGG